MYTPRNAFGLVVAALACLSLAGCNLAFLRLTAAAPSGELTGESLATAKTLTALAVTRDAAVSNTMTGGGRALAIVETLRFRTPRGVDVPLQVGKAFRVAGTGLSELGSIEVKVSETILRNSAAFPKAMATRSGSLIQLRDVTDGRIHGIAEFDPTVNRLNYFFLVRGNRIPAGFDTFQPPNRIILHDERARPIGYVRVYTTEPERDIQSYVAVAALLVGVNERSADCLQKRMEFETALDDCRRRNVSPARCEEREKQLAYRNCR